jgi:hypothetical protein
MIECLESRIAPATFLVTSLLDDASGGTLREAIALANADPATADTITFAPSAFGTIAIDPAKNAIPIAGPVTIKGPGIDKLTVSGAGTTRAFFIDDGDATKLSQVNISNLTVFGGSGGTNGGAILCFEPLALTNVAVSLGTVNEQGGGLYVDTTGKVSITGCKFHYNEAGTGGGALSVSAASLTMSKTVIAYNSVSGAGTAGGGGANLALSGPLKMTNCLVTENFSSSVGGGLLVFLPATQPAAVQNTTISDNVAMTSGGGMFFLSGILTLSGSTVHHNTADAGGGLMTSVAGVAMNIAKSVFSENSAMLAGGLGGGGICYRSSGALDIKGSQFLGNTSAVDGGALVLPGGGPATVAGSLFVGNSAGEGGGAIGITTGVSLTLKSDTFLANDATSYGGAVYSRAGGNITIMGGVFRHNVSAEGGAIGVEATAGDTFTATGVLFQQNTGDIGGAIQFRGPTTAMVKGSKFIENVSDGSDGGGIAIIGNNAVIDIIGSLFRGNYADNHGGGLSQDAPGLLTVSSCQFFDNVAGGPGGGIYLAGGITALAKLQVIGNSSNNGGGIHVTAAATATLESSTVKGNFAVANPNTFGI